MDFNKESVALDSLRPFIDLVIHYRNISAQKLPQICTLHIAKLGESGIGIILIERDIFHFYSRIPYVVDVF